MNTKSYDRMIREMAEVNVGAEEAGVEPGDERFTWVISSALVVLAEEIDELRDLIQKKEKRGSKVSL